MPSAVDLMDGIRRAFPPRPNIYNRQRSDLLRALEAEQSPELRRSLHALLVWLAGMVGDDETCDRYGTAFLETYPSYDGDLINVVSVRIRSLHRLGRHDEEKELLSHVASIQEVSVADLVTIAEPIVRNHRARVHWSEKALQKLQEYKTSDSFKGFRPSNESHTDLLVLELAVFHRELNSRLADEILRER